jgi:hypothetical protein
VTQPSTQRPRGLGYSFPIAIPLVLDPVLLVAMVVGRGKWWGLVVQGVYLAIVGYFAWVALSRTQFDKARANVPDLQRANWIMNWMFLFVIVPLLLWGFFGLRPMLNIKLPAPQWRG